MAMIVETGAGVPNANSFATIAAADAYHAARGHTDWLGDAAAKEAALVKGTQYVEANFRSRWTGERLLPRNLQGLSWPRAYATDADGFPIGSNEIPAELIAAVSEAALAEFTTEGGLSAGPTVAPGTIKREWAGDTGVEYFDPSSGGAVVTTTASTSTIDTTLAGILAPILLLGSSNVRLVRS